MSTTSSFAASIDDSSAILLSSDDGAAVSVFNGRPAAPSASAACVRPAAPRLRAAAHLANVGFALMALSLTYCISVGLPMLIPPIAIALGYTTPAAQDTVGWLVVSAIRSGPIVAGSAWLVIQTALTLGMGCSFGKWAVGLRVVMADGTPSTLLARLVRLLTFALPSFLGVLSPIYSFSVLYHILTGARPIHDRIAGTTVISVRR